MSQPQLSFHSCNTRAVVLKYFIYNIIILSGKRDTPILIVCDCVFLHGHILRLPTGAGVQLEPLCDVILDHVVCDHITAARGSIPVHPVIVVDSNSFRQRGSSNSADIRCHGCKN